MVSGKGKMVDGKYRPENAGHGRKLTQDGKGLDPLTLPLDLMRNAALYARRAAEVYWAYFDGEKPQSDFKGVRFTTIRADLCMGECSGNIAVVRNCAIIDCPAWAYRMGRNPFSPRRGFNPFVKQ